MESRPGEHAGVARARCFSWVPASGRTPHALRSARWVRLTALDVQIFTEAAMPNRPELRRRQLMETLRQEYGELGITDLRHIGEGMDARVYRAHSPELGPVAIKIPHNRWISSGNEPRL